MLPVVSLIVPAKNEEKVIKNCIESLLNLDYPKDKLEIIFSIDGSTDKTLEICKKYEPKIKIIESAPKNCKAEAINEVIPLTKGEIIGIYDADCIVKKNCLKEIVKHFSKNEVAAVNGSILSSNTKQNLLTRIISIETCFISFSEYFLHSKGANSILLGRNMFIRKKIFRKIGNFDSSDYKEDSELSIRMRRAGYKIVFEPNAITFNEEPSSMSSFFRQRKRWTRGFCKVMKKYPYRSFRNFFSDIIHGVYFYTSPFSLIMLITILAFLFILKINLIFLSPLIALFSFNMYLLIKSRLFFKQSFKYLLLLPLYFIIGNLFVSIMFLSWYEEKTNKEMMWFRADRSGLIFK